jgi:hypothetical protein
MKLVCNDLIPAKIISDILVMFAMTERFDFYCAHLRPFWCLKTHWFIGGLNRRAQRNAQYVLSLTV